VLPVIGLHSLAMEKAPILSGVGFRRCPQALKISLQHFVNESHISLHFACSFHEGKLTGHSTSVTFAALFPGLTRNGLSLRFPSIWALAFPFSQSRGLLIIKWLAS
jgi:hypothetical protein